MSALTTPDNWDSNPEYLMDRIVRQAELCESGMGSPNSISQEIAANASASAFFYAEILADVRGTP